MTAVTWYTENQRGVLFDHSVRRIWALLGVLSHEGWMTDKQFVNAALKLVGLVLVIQALTVLSYAAVVHTTSMQSPTPSDPMNANASKLTIGESSFKGLVSCLVGCFVIARSNWLTHALFAFDELLPRPRPSRLWSRRLTRITTLELLLIMAVIAPLITIWRANGSAGIGLLLIWLPIGMATYCGMGRIEKGWWGIIAATFLGLVGGCLLAFAESQLTRRPDTLLRQPDVSSAYWCHDWNCVRFGSVFSTNTEFPI